MSSYWKAIGVLFATSFAWAGCAGSPTDVPGEAEIPWDLLSGTIVVGDGTLGDIYLLDAADRTVRTVASGVFGFSSLSLRPDRKAVALAAVDLDRGLWDIRMIGITDGVTRCAIARACGDPLVATGDLEYGPAWSDSGQLAYIGTRTRPDGTRHTGIYIDGLLAHGDSLHAETQDPPVWAPDGSILAGLFGLGGPPSGVRRIDPETGSASLLIAGQVSGLAVSPDGASLAYGEDATHIWVSSNDGTGARIIADGERVITWSPDGTHVLYRGRTSSRQHGLYVAPVAGGGSTLLLPGVSDADWR